MLFSSVISLYLKSSLDLNQKPITDPKIMKWHSPCSLGGIPGSGATSTSDSEPVSRVTLENEQPSTDQHCATVAVEPLQTVQDAQPSSGEVNDTTTKPALLMAS